MTSLPRLHGRSASPVRVVSLALAGTLAAAMLAGCGSENGGEAQDGDESSSASPSADASSATPPTDTASPTPGDEPSSGGPAVMAQVYFVDEAPKRTALFSELRQLEGDNPMAEALALVLAGDADDPDYRSLAPADSLTDPKLNGDQITVTLADDSFAKRPADLKPRDAKLALQSVVYTLGAAAEKPGASVQVLAADGSTPSTYLGAGLAAATKPASPLSTLALVNVLTPAEGAEVTGSFEVSGLSNSFEATVPWQLIQGDRLVSKGVFQAEGWIEDKLFGFKGTVDVSKLAPGGYTFVASTDDPTGGTEGDGATSDSKAIVVK